LALILIVFAVNNRHLVDVSLWPLDYIVRWPLFVFVYIGALAAFLAGAAVAWASAVQRHRRARQRRSSKDARAPKAERNEGAGGPPAVID
jgi:uncharacterized integral membrane protein